MTEPLPPLVDVLAEVAYESDIARLRLEAAMGAVRDYCGWHISPVITQTFVLDGSGGRELPLPTLQLVNLVSASNDGVDVDPEWSTDGTLRICGRWTERFRGVQVVAEHGFASLPALSALVLDVAERATLGGSGLREKVGPFEFGGTDSSAAFFASELGILNRYRLPNLP
ncbi:hypothetical protein [Rhodococcus globerulus]|uniref:Head-to-tail adaptor n=1 Tax=Rhodococcus globerulus TaxID=33008 RepID=A0ABU4BSM9_RHOGO|nr:hypothetical protein [Rhodococcus globerulus]MDV6267071.1 hypothetical protein [Rhodococcus globerulus]